MHFKKAAMLLVALHVMCVKSFSQENCTNVFSGRLLDENNQPVVGAGIILLPLQHGQASDSVGRFSFSNLCAGKYQVKVQHLGCREVAFDVVVTGVTTSTIHLEAIATELNEVVVQEKKEDDNVLTSQGKTGISGEDLLKVRGTTLGESLTSIAGVYTLQSGPTIFKPVIHGLHSNRILIFNNGVRQEGQQWGSEHAPEIDPFIANRLSVIKGAASIRYGSDAIGGVILVEPAPMPELRGISGAINLAGASNNRMGVSSGILQGASCKTLPGLSWRVQGTVRRAGNSKAPGYYLENTGFEEINYSSALSYKKRNHGADVYYSQFNAMLGIFSGAHAGSITDMEAAIERKEPITPSYFSYKIDRPYQQVKHDLFKASGFLIFHNETRLDVVFARQENIRSEYDYVPLSGRQNPELYLKLVSHTMDVIYKPRVHQRYSTTLGFNGMTQGNVRQYQMLIPNFRNYSGGLFYIGKWTKDRLTLEAGGRYDYRWLRAYALDNNTAQVITPAWTFHNLTGTIGSHYFLKKNLSWAVNIGTAWRAPSVNELMSQGVHQSAIAYEIGNPDLHSERAYNFNTSLHYESSKFHAELGLYDNLIDGYIFLKPDLKYIHTIRGSYPTFTYTQVNAAFRGIDLSATYKLVDSLRWTSKTSMLFAWNKTIHDYLQLIPANRLENTLRYGFGDRGILKQFHVSMTSIWVARQRRVPANSDYLAPPPSYMLLNGNIGFSLPANRHLINVSLSAINVFNVSYRDYMDRFRTSPTSLEGIL